jgi:hypothetical protein
MVQRISLARHGVMPNGFFGRLPSVTHQLTNSELTYLRSLLCPCLRNRNFYFNRYCSEVSFSCLNHGLLENHSNFPCNHLRSFENNFIMDSPDNLGSSVHQSWWEQAQCFFCDVCSGPLDGCVVRGRPEIAQTSLIALSLAC